MAAACYTLFKSLVAVIMHSVYLFCMTTVEKVHLSLMLHFQFAVCVW